MLTPVDPTTVSFEPDRLLRGLAEADVRFVVIGGMAALIHGDIVGTADLDAAVAEDEANLRRLVRLLAALGARLLVEVGRGALATIEQPVDVAWFRRMASVRLLTVHGVLDVVLEADGMGRYPAWQRRAVPVDLDGYQVEVAALEDVIRSKRAAGRPKDVAALPRLEVLLQRSRKAGA